jgi:TonB-dependent SusC/RagA subfamily outer membrane receptor
VRRAKLASLVASLAFLPAIGVAQTREITGRVTQSEVGTPIAEATVGILGAQQGVRTNAGGEYRLRVPSGDIQVLVRAIGYKRQTRLVPSATSTVDFVLEKDVLQLEGVTVTGQATTVDRRNASTAIASVSAEELVVAPAKSLEGNLSGKVVGAAIFENSGVPGGGMQIQIRGATSILGSGDPLYVVDGVIVSNQSVASGLASVTHSSGSTNSTQDQTVNRLADINPNDIENIEVLKSAAASAIYGSRATNGVVVITTKRGRSGQTRYNVTQRVGSEQATRLLSSRHFASYADVQPYLGGSAHADSLAKANCSPACPWYDWQGQLYNVHSPSFETLMSSSGGFNSTKFFASLNDRQTPGVEQNTGARLTSGRLNLDQTIGEKFVVSGSVDVSHDLTHDGFGNNDNSGTSPIYTFGYAPAIYNLNAIDPVTGRPISMWMNGGGSGTSNPFDVVHAVLNSEETWRQIGNVRLDYSAMSSVHHTIDLHYIGGVDRFQFTGNQYSPNYLQFESADGFLGTSQINTTESFGINESLNGVWTFSPGKKWLNSAQTSVGLAYGSSHVRNYFVRERGLTPTSRRATRSSISATKGTTSTSRSSRSTKSSPYPPASATTAAAPMAIAPNSTRSPSTRRATGSPTRSASSRARSTK